MFITLKKINVACLRAVEYRAKTRRENVRREVGKIASEQAFYDALDFQRRSCRLSFPVPLRCQSAPESLLACYGKKGAKSGVPG